MEPTTTFEPTTSTTSTTSTTTTPCPPDPITGIRPTNGMITATKNSNGTRDYYIVVQCIKIPVKSNIGELLESLRLALIALQEANKYKTELVLLNGRLVDSIRTAPTSPSPGQPSVYYFQDLRASNLALIVNAEANITTIELNISQIQSAIGAASLADWTPEMRQAFVNDKTQTYKQPINADFLGMTTFSTTEPRIPAYFIPGPRQTEDR